MEDGRIDRWRSIAALGVQQGLKGAASRIVHEWDQLMEHLTAQPAPKDFGLLVIACKTGSLEFVSWARNHPHLYPFPQSLPEAAVAAAIKHGHAHILKWILGHLPAQQQVHALSKALIFPAQQGDLATLELGFQLAQVQEGDETWMQCLIEACCNSDISPSDIWYNNSARRQHLQVISWLGRHLQSAFATVFDTYFTGERGRLGHAEQRKIDAIIKACHERTVPVQLAAKGIQPCIPWDDWNIRAAYTFGDKEVIKASHASFQCGVLESQVFFNAIAKQHHNFQGVPCFAGCNISA